MVVAAESIRDSAITESASRKRVETPAESEQSSHPDLSLVALVGKNNAGEVKDAQAPLANRNKSDTLDLGADNIYAASDKTREAARPEEVYEDSRKRLVGLVDDQMSVPKAFRDNVRGAYKDTFEKDMAKFEERVKKGDVTPEEADQTYKKIGDLLSSDSKLTTPQQRQQLAKNLMFHTANPRLTDQGIYNTCASTAIAERLFERNPSVAADMVLQAATTGKYIGSDGQEVKIDTDSLKADKHTMAGRPLDLDRSYSTQVLNNVISNDAMQHSREPRFYKQQFMGNDFYEKMMQSDNGERTLEPDGSEMTEDGRKIRNPVINIADMEQAMHRYTGDRGLVLSNSKSVNEEQYAGLMSRFERRAISEFQTVAEMRQKLETLDKDGKMPLIATVFADNEALTRGLPEAISSGGHQQGHVVSIKDYDAKTGKVTISNQWGKDSDRTLSAQEFFEATVPRAVRHNRRTR